MNREFQAYMLRETPKGVRGSLESVTLADLGLEQSSLPAPRGFAVQVRINTETLGADGIVVSNHGGRQLDAAPSVVSVLPAIRRAVGPDATLVADSGVRSGLDISCGLQRSLVIRRRSGYGELQHRYRHVNQRPCQREP